MGNGMSIMIFLFGVEWLYFRIKWKKNVLKNIEEVEWFIYKIEKEICM